MAHTLPVATRSRRLYGFVLVTISMALFSCDQETSLPTENGRKNIETTISLTTPASFKLAETLLKEGSRDKAREMTNQLITLESPTELNQRLNGYWALNSNTRYPEMAVLLAKQMADSQITTRTASYIAGLAYYNGVTVEKSLKQAAIYWDVPSLADSGVTQYRLGTIYKDPGSGVFNIEKSKKKFQSAINLNYIP